MLEVVVAVLGQEQVVMVDSVAVV
jgi:hypothetical protein